MKEDTALERLFIGAAGPGLLRHGGTNLDGTTAYQFRLLTNPLAPEGLLARDYLFRNIYVTIEGLSKGLVNVTPIVDGAYQHTIQIAVDSTNPERRRYEVPITAPYAPGGIEVSRRGVRGTWVQVLIIGADSEGIEFSIANEGIEVEYDALRETIGQQRVFSAMDQVQLDQPGLETLFIGEAADGLWAMDAGGAGSGGCLSGTAGGICKLVEGLVVGLDYSVGADRLQMGDELTGTRGWVVISGQPPVDDPVNGYLVLPSTVTMYWFDPAQPETAEQMVMSEVQYAGCDDILPGVLTLARSLADDSVWSHYYCMETWIVTCTDERMVLGKRVVGTDAALSNVLVAGVQPSIWYWISSLVVPDLTDNKVYGSGNDNNWEVGGPLNVNRDTDLFGRVGLPGVRAWLVGGNPGPRSALLRRWRWHRNARIEMRNVPDQHQVVIERDAGYIGTAPLAKTFTMQNTSGSAQTLLLDNEGYPVSTPEKGIAPYTRIYITTIADPATKVAELVEDVNWGSVYSFNDAPAGLLSYLLEPNDVAPAGTGGECHFRNVYVAVTRNNETPVDCFFTAIIDDVELPQMPLTFAALPDAHPVTEIVEIPLPQPYGPQAVEASRRGLRGTWFRFRIESDTYADDGSRLIFEGAEIEFTVEREQQRVETTVVSSPGAGLGSPPPPAQDSIRITEAGDDRITEAGDTRVTE